MTSEPQQPSIADVLAEIRDFRAHLDRRFSDVDQQFVEMATDINAHFTTQDQQMTDLMTFLKVRFDHIDARLEELAAPQQVGAIPTQIERVS